MIVSTGLADRLVGVNDDENWNPQLCDVEFPVEI